MQDLAGVSAAGSSIGKVDNRLQPSTPCYIRLLLQASEGLRSRSEKHERWRQSGQISLSPRASTLSRHRGLQSSRCASIDYKAAGESTIKNQRRLAVLSFSTLPAANPF